MANVYVDLIIEGFKTLDEVPEKLRSEVKALLEVTGVGTD